jgi:hypothetical protein
METEVTCWLASVWIMETSSQYVVWNGLG